MKILKSDEIYNCIENMIKRAGRSIKISSAWLKGSLVKRLLDNLPDADIKIEVILRASELRDLLITDDIVFRRIKENNGKIYLNSRLHAKFILVDDKEAVIGSANFTEAGFSNYSEGNIEAAFYCNNDREIKKLIEYFEQIKEDSVAFDDELIGFSINPVKSSSFEFILLDSEIKEQSYVVVKQKGYAVLARIVSIYSYDMGFFANPFSAGESQIFGSIEAFKLLFSDRKDKEWKKAAVQAYLNENSNKVRIAVAQIVGAVNNEKVEAVMKPFDVGEAVYLASSDILKKLMKSNFSGKHMEYPVRIGTLEGSNEEVFIDGKEVITKHMLILGTTGSGKSHFTKVFLSEFLKNYPVQAFIFDPHGEYYEELIEFGISPEEILHLKFKETIFPIYPEEIESLIKQLGYAYLINGKTEVGRANRLKLASFIKPSLRKTVFTEKNLYDVLSSLKRDKNSEEMGVEEEARDILGENIITNQKEICESMQLALNSGKKLIIFNFSYIGDSRTRVNIAGLIMQELFNQNKEHRKERVLVLEEAHSFAPEVSYGDVSAGKDNLALIMARKIASEGRKFNIGLVVITQRPAQVSKYVLSQANTQAMFRTINDIDLATIGTYVEFAGKDIINLLPSLQTGIGILSGLGTPFPMVVKVR